MASKGKNSDGKSVCGGFGAGQIKITPLTNCCNYKLLSGAVFLSYCL